MHRQFRRALEAAEGVSRNVVVAFFDIRGFSGFSTQVDAVETAAYVKRIYQRAIDNYFSQATFFKPTGDGLMVVFEYDEKSLMATARLVVDACIKLLEDFGTLARDDPMVNFPVPDKAGFGIARGAACCITTGKLTLDYSGRLLNLAARLMDVARPEGIVIDGAFGIELLQPDRQTLFERTSVVVRGIAEAAPGREIVFTKDRTVIPDSRRRSLDKPPWRSVESDFKTFAEFKELGPNYRIALPSTPPDPRTIRPIIRFPSATRGGKRHPTLWTHLPLSDEEFSYAPVGEEPGVTIETKPISKRMEDEGIKRTWPVHLELMYVE